MTTIKKILIAILALLFLLLATTAGLFATGNEHLIRAVQLTYLKGNTTANINDHRDFDTRLIKAGEAQPWALHPDYNKIPLRKELEGFLTRTNSVGYLIIKDGLLHSEYYFAPYDPRSRTNSFSMAKSLLTMMVGAAIEDGMIGSFDERLDLLVPELQGKASDVTLAQLSAMSSGVDWDEHYYSPFSPTPKLLYGYDVESFSLSRDYPKAGGETYYYASVSTQVLGIALQRALQKAGSTQTLSDYFSDKFWIPLGMDDDGLWHTDTKGMELVFCCVNTNARNFAKFGQLLLNKGRWGEQQLLSEAFVDRMIQPDIMNYYGHSIWIDERENPIYYLLMGHLGQYVIVVPEHNMVVVRLGEFRDADADHMTFFIPKEVNYYVDEALARVQ